VAQVPRLAKGMFVIARICIPNVLTRYGEFAETLYAGQSPTTPRGKCMSLLSTVELCYAVAGLFWVAQASTSGPVSGAVVRQDACAN
jgi:hypothetical protein